MDNSILTLGSFLTKIFKLIYVVKFLIQPADKEICRNFQN